ncbi:MAG: fatty acid CoA ligase family protein [Planctomycetota bacterium]
MMALKPLNIASHLPVMAKQQPDGLAIVVQKPRRGSRPLEYEEVTFAELDRESDRLAAGLDGAGIRRGARTVLMVKPGRAFFALTFALFRVGAVPVLVDPGMGIRNLRKCLEEAQPEAFIGIPKAQAARMVLGWGRSSIRKLVTVGRRLFWVGISYDQLLRGTGSSYKIHPPEAGETAAILFTSGSTGAPKGAVYTHEIFNAQVEVLRRDYGIEPGERDLATFPLFALFGPALGMAAVVPDMDASKPAEADPQKIVAAIEAYQATNMFASPALIEVVGRHGQARKQAGSPVVLPSLKRVISAGAPADADSLDRFTDLLLPGVEVLTSYGATEALPVSFIGTNELLSDTAEKTANGAGVCVGRPIQEAEVAIIPIHDEPIERWSPALKVPDGEIGEIAVKGPMVSRTYFRRDRATSLAKIPDPDGGGFYHRMGDVGYFDSQGRLWMCGRKTHRVDLGEETLFTLPCERVFNVMPEVRRTALVPCKVKGFTCPVLCVELNPGESDHERIRDGLLEMGAANEKTRKIKTILFHPGFPVDIRHNAKIFREKLALWAQKKLDSGGLP